jgi:small redox-active disulfide protein 2
MGEPQRGEIWLEGGMKIEVLGTGCIRCNTAEAMVREAVALKGLEAEVVKVSNRLEIAKRGVFMTPAIIIDGQVKSVGLIPEVEDVLTWFAEMEIS